jgi:N-acetylmuramoyl-L-alanine amidase
MKKIIYAICALLIVIASIVLGTLIGATLTLDKASVAPTEPAPIIIECNHPIEVIIEQPVIVEPEAIAPSEEVEPETIEPTEPEVELPPIEINWHSDIRVEETGIETIEVNGEPVDIEFLAKLLYAEAGTMDWWGKVYTCSAILNFCDTEQRDLWAVGHDKNCFAVAPYVDSVEPTEEIYEVIDYVLGGGRIADICYFRTGYYHTFGTPVCQVGAHYFSK